MADITVKQLKKALRGVPDDAIILLCDHDHGEDEYNGTASGMGHVSPGDELHDAFDENHPTVVDIFWLKV